jgi:catechol 2,3-dioxygenase-like lactoylglutathione lyase family enzyme
MTIKRMDHVSVVIDDLPAAVAFFTTLGMTLEGEMTVEDGWVDGGELKPGVSPHGP